MVNIFEWYSQGVEERRIVGMRDRGIMTYIKPIYIVLQLGLYFYYRDSLYEHGALIIGAPMLAVLIMVIYIRWNERNIRGTGGYHLTHLSKMTRMMIIFMVVFAFYLFLFSQCQQYYLAINSVCLERIFIHGNK